MIVYKFSVIVLLIICRTESEYAAQNPIAKFLLVRSLVRVALRLRDAEVAEALAAAVDEVNDALHALCVRRFPGSWGSLPQSPDTSLAFSEALLARSHDPHDLSQRLELSTVYAHLTTESLLLKTLIQYQLTVLFEYRVLYNVKKLLRQCPRTSTSVVGGLNVTNEEHCILNV